MPAPTMSPTPYTTSENRPMVRRSVDRGLVMRVVRAPNPIGSRSPSCLERLGSQWPLAPGSYPPHDPLHAEEHRPHDLRLTAGHDTADAPAGERELDIDDARRRRRHQTSLLDSKVILADSHPVAQEAGERSGGHAG